MHLRTTAVFCLLLLAGGLCGCRGYRSGSLMHPDLRRIAVAGVDNRTSHPGAETLLRSHLGRELSRSPAVRLSRAAKADGHLRVTLEESTTAPSARTRVRPPEVGEDEDDVQQVVLYRTRVTLVGRLASPEAEDSPVVTRRVTGTADFDRTPDVSEARDAAFDRALQNAARTLVTTLTEAW